MLTLAVLPVVVFAQSLLQQANTAFASGNYSDAKDLYEMAASFAEDSAEREKMYAKAKTSGDLISLHAKARKAYMNEDYESAINYYKKIQKLNPKDFIAEDKLAMIEETIAKIKEAEEAAAAEQVAVAEQVVATPDVIASKEDSEAISQVTKEDEVVHIRVDRMPEFPGGQAALVNYLVNNVIYPIPAQEQGIQGRVVCQFIVEKDGSVGDVKVIRGVHESLDNEAIRVVEAMPKWIPGVQGGEIVRVRYTLPIRFNLQ